MAITTQTFTVYSQSYTNDLGELKFAPRRTWRAFFDAMASANIGWTKTVITDTLATNDSGEYSCTMTHTLSGMYFTATNPSEAELRLNFYDSTGNAVSNYIGIIRPSDIHGENTYYVDSLGTCIQEARFSQGQSNRMWCIVIGDLVSGAACPMQSAISTSDTQLAGPNNAMFTDLITHADEQNVNQYMSRSYGYFTVKATGQLVLRRWYGYFPGMTDGVIVTMGGKKLWYTQNYTFIPKAVYLINNKRYIALNAYLIIEE